MTNLIKKKIEEFRRKVFELKNDNHFQNGETKLYYFGYRTKVNNEIYTITDWGNFEQFLTQAMQEVREETIKEVRNYLKNDWDVEGMLNKLMKEEK